MAQKKPKNKAISISLRQLVGIIVVLFIAVGAYYGLQENQTVYVPVKTSESPATAPSGTAAQTPTPTPTPTVTAPPTPIPTTAKPTATPPPVPTVTEATPPPTPVITSQTPVQTVAQPTPAQTQANKASYVSANFQSGGIKGSRITVPQGSSVDVYVVVTGYGSGILKTEVKKDIIWGSDIVLTTFQNQIFLNGEQTIKVGTFSAGDLSGQNSFREYFAKVYWNDNNIFDPTDPNSRPAVITSAQTIGQAGTLEFQQLLFGNPPQTTLTVGRYTVVPVYLRLRAVGQVSKPVKVEIRKDIIASLDLSYTTLEQTITMKDETKNYYIGSFTPDQITTWWGLRQYFGRVDINSDGTWDYDPQDPASRPHVLVN